LVDQYTKIDSRVIGLSLGMVFGGAAPNFFRILREVDLSKFDYVSFADQDDIWFEDKLVRAVNKIIETKSDGYSSNVLAFWPTGEQKLIVKSQPQREWDYLFEAAGPGCTYLMTVKLALKIKKTIDTDWLEVNKLGLHDWYCYAYARANGFDWFIDSWPSMLYRQHSNNQVGVNKGWRAFLYRLNKVTGGWGFEQALLIAELVGKGDSEFVKRWRNFKRHNFLMLALHANESRRKPTDQILFFLACLVMAVIGKR
jgi:rhamnosyltransferase